VAPPRFSITDNTNDTGILMRTILLTVLLIILVGMTAVAQVPRLVSFQGRARDAQGNFPDDTRQVTVTIYDAPTGGTPLHSETHSTTFRQGAFTILIGMNQPGGIPASVEFDRPLWLEVSVQNFNGGQPLTPRMQFASAPSALNAEHATSAETLEPGATITGQATGGVLEVANEVGPGIVVQGGTYATVELGIDSTSHHFVSGDTLGSAQAPEPGSLFRDNAPIAWGLINEDGTILSDFGIRSVQKTGTGQYEVVLDIPAVMVPVPKGRNAPSYAPMIQPTALSDIGAPIVGQWSFKPGATDENRRIVVRTTSSVTGTASPVDASFSIIVFGRPVK
jgi:hypothetical protein